MFDVRCSSFETTPYGINATCECLQNNLALMMVVPVPQFQVSSFKFLSDNQKDDLGRVRELYFVKANIKTYTGENVIGKSIFTLSGSSR